MFRSLALSIITFLIVTLPNESFGLQSFQKLFVPNPQFYFTQKCMEAGNMNFELDSSLYSFYNRTYKIGIGVDIQTFRMDRAMMNYSDTSEHSFSIGNYSPWITFSSDVILGERFSLGYTVGYQDCNIVYDGRQYEKYRLQFMINPRLSLINSHDFEYYMKMNIGYMYRNVNSEVVPLQMQRIFPERHQLYTGVTLVGLNYFPNKHWGANFEFSIWSPETLSFGITYRFLKVPK